MSELREAFDRLDSAVRALRESTLTSEAYRDLPTPMFSALRERIYEVEAAAAQLGKAAEQKSDDVNGESLPDS